MLWQNHGLWVQVYHFFGVNTATKELSRLPCSNHGLCVIIAAFHVFFQQAMVIVISQLFPSSIDQLQQVRFITQCPLSTFFQWEYVLSEFLTWLTTHFHHPSSSPMDSCCPCKQETRPYVNGFLLDCHDHSTQKTLRGLTAKRSSYNQCVCWFALAWRHPPCGSLDWGHSFMLLWTQGGWVFFNVLYSHSLQLHQLDHVFCMYC
jgi:hypothetical protein